MMQGVKLFPQESLWANVTVLIFSYKKDCACLFILTRKHVQTDKNAFSAGCDIKKEPILVYILFLTHGNPFPQKRPKY